MVIRRATGAFDHRRVADLPAFLHPGDLLVVNDTRVIPARLYGQKAGTGGRVEILLIEETETGVWEALLRARHAKPGDCLELADSKIQAEVFWRLQRTRDRVGTASRLPARSVPAFFWD